MSYKTPVSVLVLVHTADLQVLLLERADHPGFWQSVTGSQDAGETLLQTAQRELVEEMPMIFITRVVITLGYADGLIEPVPVNLGTYPIWAEIGYE